MLVAKSRKRGLFGFFPRDDKDECHDTRGCFVGFGIVACVVAVGLVVERAVATLSHRQPPAIGNHSFAKAVGVDVCSESGVSHETQEVAHACGFCDHSAFTRAFRSAAGMTPSEFRTQY